MRSRTRRCLSGPGATEDEMVGCMMSECSTISGTTASPTITTAATTRTRVGTTNTQPRTTSPSTGIELHQVHITDESSFTQSLCI